MSSSRDGKAVNLGDIMQDEASAALYVEGLSVNFDTTSVLWDIHFSIPAGRLVGIVGPQATIQVLSINTQSK